MHCRETFAFTWNGKANGVMSVERHDKECDMKLRPMRDDLKEIKRDIKELLRRNGGG